jgi:Pyruvate kinase
MSRHSEKYAYTGKDKQIGIEHSTKRTKIVATVGPASNSYETMLRLAQAGVNVFRLNFSHGSHEDKKEIIDNIRRINSEQPFEIAILGDLQGPKLRVGEIENNALPIKPGDVLTFTNEKCVGTMEKIYVSYPNLAGDVSIGNKIMIDDGKLEVIVKGMTQWRCKSGSNHWWRTLQQKRHQLPIPKFLCVHLQIKIWLT